MLPIPAFQENPCNESYPTTPDAHAARLAGPDAGVGRVYGPDLMLAVCDAGRRHGLRHYFYGGAPGVAELLREKLTTRFPGLEIAGTFTPPYRPLNPAELAALRANVARTRPDIIWVGLGTPKQERFMAENWRTLGAGLLIGVGAVPLIFIPAGCRRHRAGCSAADSNWLFRLCTEPRRLRTALPRQKRPTRSLYYACSRKGPA